MTTRNNKAWVKTGETLAEQAAEITRLRGRVAELERQLGVDAADEPITAEALVREGWKISKPYINLTRYIHPKDFVWVCIDEGGCVVVASDDKSSGSHARGCTTMQDLAQLVRMFTPREEATR